MILSSFFVILLLFAGVSYAAVPSTIGWYVQPGSKVYDVCPPNNFGGSGYFFKDLCDGVLNEWTGAAVDTTRNRLIMWGGGHNGYGGNEIYAFTPSTGLTTRLNDPGLPLPTTCTQGTVSDTQANIRHTYDGIAYMANKDKLFVQGGALYCPSGLEADGDIVWLFNFATMAWEKKIPANIGGSPDINLNGHTSAYDPTTGFVFFHNRAAFFSFDHDTGSQGTITRRSTNVPVSVNWEQTAVIDPDRKLYIMVGAGVVLTYDITAGGSYTATSRTDTGATTCANSISPGLSYDPHNKRVVCWNGGNTVYFLNTTTWVWTSQTVAGGPVLGTGCGSAITCIDNGTWERFSYIPNLGVYASCNQVDVNCSVLRLDTVEQVDFLQRCTAPGVLRCVKFDSASDFVNGGTNQVTIAPGDDAVTVPVLDTTISASGGGSAKFVVPNPSTSNPSGEYRINIGQNIGQGETVYFQFRQRMTPEYIQAYAGTSGWKQFILWHDAGGGSCTDVQLVSNLYQWLGFPIVYTACGGTGAWITDPDGDVEFNFGATTGGPGAGGYWCTNRHDQTGENDCAYFLANTWQTFTFRLTIGTWNAANSIVQAWLQNTPGTPSRLWVNKNNFNISNDTPATKFFRQFALMTYMTGKSATGGHAGGITWFDELIVSTQPIADPEVATPAPPTLLKGGSLFSGKSVLGGHGLIQ